MPITISAVTAPDEVKTGEEFKIEVNADAVFEFSDLSGMTWETVESRLLTWVNIDETFTFNDLEGQTWRTVEDKLTKWNDFK